MINRYAVTARIERLGVRKHLLKASNEDRAFLKLVRAYPGRKITELIIQKRHVVIEASQ